jgi:hypothetical protein
MAATKPMHKGRCLSVVPLISFLSPGQVSTSASSCKHDVPSSVSKSIKSQADLQVCRLALHNSPSTEVAHSHKTHKAVRHEAHQLTLTYAFLHLYRVLTSRNRTMQSAPAPQLLGGHITGPGILWYSWLRLAGLQNGKLSSSFVDRGSNRLNTSMMLRTHIIHDPTDNNRSDEFEACRLASTLMIKHDDSSSLCRFVDFNRCW